MGIGELLLERRKSEEINQANLTDFPNFTNLINQMMKKHWI